MIKQRYKNEFTINNTKSINLGNSFQYNENYGL